MAEFLLRWFHYLGGITWIGLLYYFNFVQGPFMAEADPAAKSTATQKLLPRALACPPDAAALADAITICCFGQMTRTTLKNISVPNSAPVRIVIAHGVDQAPAPSGDSPSRFPTRTPSRAGCGCRRRSATS